MSVQWIGLVSAAATFLGVWLGHVAVRKIEFLAPNIWLPALAAVLLGLASEVLALASHDDTLSVFLGIVGVTLLWDGFEFWRQQKRVEKGHAPANPANPRHARILQESPAATTLNLLDRHPVGRRVHADEAIRLILGMWL
jgi:hypothetical protein